MTTSVPRPSSPIVVVVSGASPTNAATVAPEQRFDGILGRDFFADGLLVLDYPRTRLAYGTSSAIAPDAENAVAYERPYRVPVSIGDEVVFGAMGEQVLTEKIAAARAQCQTAAC